MLAWWNSLEIALQVFYTIAFASSLVLVIQLFLNLFGLAAHDMDTSGGDAGGVPEHTDFETHSSGLALLSMRTVTAFFAGFGWAGVALLNSKMPMWGTLPIAFAVGTVFLLVVFYLMKAIFRLSESGNVDYGNAVGQTGTVYIPIPPQGKGAGQVQLVVQGRMRELPAVSEAAERLPSGTPVQVLKMLSDSTAVVRKLEVQG